MHMVNRQSRIPETSFYRISLTYQHRFDTSKESKTEEIWTNNEKLFFHPLNVKDIIDKFLLSENHSTKLHGHPQQITVEISGPFRIVDDNTMTYSVSIDDYGDLYLDLSEIRA